LDAEWSRTRLARTVKSRLVHCARLTLMTLAAAVAVLGCGPEEAGPAEAIDAYLTALATNEGQKACDLLTVEARAQLVEDAGNTDCPALVDTFHTFLRGDAERLKDADVGTVSATGDEATALVALEGHTTQVSLRRVTGEWRIHTFGFATSLLGAD
jgi:hypothetical protein